MLTFAVKNFNTFTFNIQEKKTNMNVSTYHFSVKLRVLLFTIHKVSQSVTRYHKKNLQNLRQMPNHT